MNYSEELYRIYGDKVVNIVQTGDELTSYKLTSPASTDELSQVANLPKSLRQRILIIENKIL
ncbi:hypothetical protein CL622_05715 [archaeon]|nr:hypothetical protein [archaeon]